MEQAQKDYFVRRLNEVAQEKVRAKEVELFGEGGVQQPTWGMVFAAIKAGEIVLKEGTEGNTKPYLMPQDVEWPALEAKRDQLVAYRKQIEVEKRKAMDAIMLDTQALEALNAFEAL